MNTCPKCDSKLRNLKKTLPVGRIYKVSGYCPTCQENVEYNVFLMKIYPEEVKQ